MYNTNLVWISSSFFLFVPRGGVTIEFSDMRGPNKKFGSFILQNEPNILFGPLNSENSIITPPLIVDFETHVHKGFCFEMFFL